MFPKRIEKGDTEMKGTTEDVTNGFGRSVDCTDEIEYF